MLLVDNGADEQAFFLEFGSVRSKELADDDKSTRFDVQEKKLPQGGRRKLRLELAGPGHCSQTISVIFHVSNVRCPILSCGKLHRNGVRCEGREHPLRTVGNTMSLQAQVTGTNSASDD